MVVWTFLMLFVPVAVHAASMQATIEDCMSSTDRDSCESQFEKSSLLQTRVSHSHSSVGEDRAKTTKESCPDCKAGSVMQMTGRTWQQLQSCCDCVNEGNSWVTRVQGGVTQRWCYMALITKPAEISWADTVTINETNCPEYPCDGPTKYCMTENAPVDATSGNSCQNAMWAAKAAVSRGKKRDRRKYRGSGLTAQSGWNDFQFYIAPAKGCFSPCKFCKTEDPPTDAKSGNSCQKAMWLAKKTGKSPFKTRGKPRGNFDYTGSGLSPQSKWRDFQKYLAPSLGCRLPCSP
jgi:hypothetical protein